MATRTPKSITIRIFLWIAAILGGLAIIYAIVMGRMMARMGNVPSDLDYATTHESDNGLYRVSYTASNGVIPINQMHEWTLHVETAEGTPIEDATITVDGDMPQHGHGLPTSPRVTQYLGNGDYLVEGLKFQMAGWWLMDFTISANGQTDAVHFNMLLK
jgi:YtkA-like protein